MSGKGSGRRPGTGYAEGWDAIFGKKQPPEVVMCGGCGETDPQKRCLGCGHDFYNEPKLGKKEG